MDQPTPGEVAYTAYAAAREWLPLPAWDAQHPDFRAAWEAAANAVMSAYAAGELRNAVPPEAQTKAVMEALRKVGFREKKPL